MASDSTTDSDNPYAVSRHCAGLADVSFVAANPADFVVINDLIVCSHQVILPKICALTGATKDLVPVTVRTQFPSFKLVVVQRYCSVTYFISRSRRTRRRLRTLATIGTALGAVALIILGASINDPQFGPLVALLGILMFVAVFVSALFSVPALRLERFESPNTYLIRGFSQSYLREIMPYQSNPGTFADS